MIERKAICGRCGKLKTQGIACPCTPKREYKKTKYIKREISKEQKARDRILRTKKWERLKKRVLIRDKYICLRCFIKHGRINNFDLTIHHIKSRKEHPELFFDINNLICVCRKCNSALEYVSKNHELDFKPISFIQKDIIL